MGPEPATSKSKGSRYRSNEGLPNHRAGELMERGSQRPETGRGKSDKEGGGTESGRGVKRRQHGAGGDGGQGGTLGSMSSTHRTSKRWRGDTLEIQGIPIPTDRWDGGTSDVLKDNAFLSGRSRHESETRSGEGLSPKVVKEHSLKEGGDPDKGFRKQKVSKTSLLSDFRAITVMDLQETDTGIIDSNIRIKNKVSYRRDATFELGQPEHEKNIEENAKNSIESFRSRRRWDRDGHRGVTDASSNDGQGHGNLGEEGSEEGDRKKEMSIGKDREAVARMQNGQRSAGGGRDLAVEIDGRLEVSDELDNSNDFKLQEGLRNIELEKELENRIRRRREESGDRDRWRDDDRERDGKRHSDSREQDERTRDERHRSRRDRERHSERHEIRQHREGSKLSEVRQREDRYNESDRECRSHREERYHRARSKDLEDYGRGERNRDQDHRDRKGRENIAGYDAERRGREKAQKDDQPDRDRSYCMTAYVESSDGARNEHRHKRVREGDGDGESFGTMKDHFRLRGHPGDPDTSVGNDLVHIDRLGWKREDRDQEGRVDRFRGSPRDKDYLRCKGKSNVWRNDGPLSEMAGECFFSPRHDGRNSPSSNRVDDMSSSQLDGQRSPQYQSQRSPSHIDRTSGASKGKSNHVDWFEPSNSGPQRRALGSGLLIIDRQDRVKRNSSTEEEMKSGMLRINRGVVEGREGLSPHRLNNQHLPTTQVKPPLHGQDSFLRGMGCRGTTDSRSDRGGWRVPSSFDGGQLDHYGPDDLSPRERSDRVRRIPVNRAPGSPVVRSQGPQMSSLPTPVLALLPPPPPFRPGIDNPAVFGTLNGGFDDSGGSREQGRGERKGAAHRRGDPGGTGEGWGGVNIGNWNSRNQGPLSGNGYTPFSPQFAHPPAGGGGFPGMVQQFPGPPIFPGGGGRPLMDLGFGGARILGPAGPIGEGGDGYLVRGRGTGWHGPGEVDDGRGQPLSCSSDGWEGLGPHVDDRLRHGRMDWERGAPFGVRGWDRDRERDIWEACRDGVPEFMPHRSQMDSLPPNKAFSSAGSGWVGQRDAHVPNDIKPQPDRKSCDVQEGNRKPDGEAPKLKLMKLSGRAVSTSEGKLSKFATGSLQAVLSQLDISPDLAGPELYAQYQALLPPSALEKENAYEGQDMPISEREDDDLNLEADPEAEALIAGPSGFAKLLPPLPDGVFQEALQLYRKPDRDNRVQKSSRGCFVLPFDPSTITLPSISLRLNRPYPRKARDQAHDGMGGLLRQLNVSVLDAEFTKVLVEPNKQVLNPLELRQEGLESEASETEIRKGEAIPDDFIASHVEVAEYSDREVEAEVEDTLEDDSMKELQVDGAPLGKGSTGNIPVNSESIETVDTLVHAKESLMTVDNICVVMNAAKNLYVVAERQERVDNLVLEANQFDNLVVEACQSNTKDFEDDPGKNVNSFVVSEGAVNHDNFLNRGKNYIVEKVVNTFIGETVHLEVIQSSGKFLGEFVKPQNGQFSVDFSEDDSLEAPAPKQGIEAVEDIHEETLEKKIGTGVHDKIEEAVACDQSNDGCKEAEEVGVLEPMDNEGNGLDVKITPSEVGKVENMRNYLSEDVLTTVSRVDMKIGTYGKSKEIAESPPASEQPLLEELRAEPLTRLRKRRASSRLLAQQSTETPVVPLQESSDQSVGQGSEEIKVLGTRGTTRSSQRRSRRRGSIH